MSSFGGGRKARPKPPPWRYNNHKSNKADNAVNASIHQNKKRKRNVGSPDEQPLTRHGQHVTELPFDEDGTLTWMKPEKVSYIKASKSNLDGLLCKDHPDQVNWVTSSKSKDVMKVRTGLVGCNEPSFGALVETLRQFVKDSNGEFIKFTFESLSKNSHNSMKSRLPNAHGTQAQPAPPVYRPLLVPKSQSKSRPNPKPEVKPQVQPELLRADLPPARGSETLPPVRTPMEVQQRRPNPPPSAPRAPEVTLPGRTSIRDLMLQAKNEGKCAYCGSPRHVLAYCPFPQKDKDNFPHPVTGDGAIRYCPVHNVCDHEFDDCPEVLVRMATRDTDDIGFFYHYMVRCRINKPLIRSANICWAQVAFQARRYFPVAEGFPWTKAFTKYVNQTPSARVLPSFKGKTHWKDWRPKNPEDEFEAKVLPVDPAVNCFIDEFCKRFTGQQDPPIPSQTIRDFKAEEASPSNVKIKVEDSFY